MNIIKTMILFSLFFISYSSSSGFVRVEIPSCAMEVHREMVKVRSDLFNVRDKLKHMIYGRSSNLPTSINNQFVQLWNNLNSLKEELGKAACESKKKK